ncbi:MAG: hypothetical protein ACRD0D_13750, partial [Acidimicrobiales bacterium]
AIATLILAVVAIGYMGWILDNLINVDTWQYAAGLVAAIVMTWAGWQTYQAEKGAVPAPPAAPPPAAPPPAPPTS